MSFFDIIEMVLDLIYPPRCMVCCQILAIEKPRWLCEYCAPLLEPISGPVCLKCGMPLENEKTLCRRCSSLNLSFERNYSFFLYDDVVRELIHNFKYNGNPAYAKAIGQLLMKDHLDLSFFENIDLITCVPLHKAKKRMRGFNQAELLANEISALTGLPLVKNLLYRHKNTKPQSRLNWQGRQANVKNAFTMNTRHDIEGRNIVIVDDIFTTGSTLSECSDVLLSHGAAKILCFTLSIAERKENSSSVIKM